MRLLGIIVSPMRLSHDGELPDGVAEKFIEIFYFHWSKITHAIFHYKL